MKNSKKSISKTEEKISKFSVSGIDWRTTIEIDEGVFDEIGEQYIEAASRAIERTMIKKKISIGPVVEVKKLNNKKSALVNTYICLNNIGKYSQAEELRRGFMEFSGGQDLAVDKKGYGEL
jgi:hypothetical protein